MTITYSLEVSNARFCGFTNLLLRWKGSIYKFLWREVIIFLICYYALNALYRYILRGTEKRVFEEISVYCAAFTDLIPLSFVLAFYVSQVMGRWWAQYEAIPWPDRTALMIASFVHGADERSRMIRRTLGRYLILMQVFTFQAVSTAIKKRLPTEDHLLEAGLMTEEEKKQYDKLKNQLSTKWWLPAQWFSALTVRARKERRNKDSIQMQALLNEMLMFRGLCGTMLSYDWISLPLAYTQVVTIATYTYFVAQIMGRQYLDPELGYTGYVIDQYIPVFTLLQFFFYVGWLKVAEELINPYGEDDDDFELNWSLERNIQIVFLIVDHLHSQHPRIKRDFFWDELEPHLPHTKVSQLNNRLYNPQIGSAANLEFGSSDATFLPLETTIEQDRQENVYNTPTVELGGPPNFFRDILGGSLHFNINRGNSKLSSSEDNTKLLNSKKTGKGGLRHATKTTSPKQHGIPSGHYGSTKTTSSGPTAPLHTPFILKYPFSNLSQRRNKLNRFKNKNKRFETSDSDMTSSFDNSVPRLLMKQGTSFAGPSAFTVSKPYFTSINNAQSYISDSVSGPNPSDSLMIPTLSGPNSPMPSIPEETSNANCFDDDKSLLMPVILEETSNKLIHREVTPILEVNSSSETVLLEQETSKPLDDSDNSSTKEDFQGEANTSESDETKASNSDIYNSGSDISHIRKRSPVDSTMYESCCSVGSDSSDSDGKKMKKSKKR
ncbi:bestrophin-2a-like isoform X1 [Tachypleus tridentatus]|uniref:bestrophin-2a-like isoform X1 n=2 Tax=Tachypleus tridentatus TaxID=6853 RepID=UPI003FD44010